MKISEFDAGARKTPQATRASASKFVASEATRVAYLAQPARFIDLNLWLFCKLGAQRGQPGVGSSASPAAAPIVASPPSRSHFEQRSLSLIPCLHKIEQDRDRPLPAASPPTINNHGNENALQTPLRNVASWGFPRFCQAFRCERTRRPVSNAFVSYASFLKSFIFARRGLARETSSLPAFAAEPPWSMLPSERARCARLMGALAFMRIPIIAARAGATVTFSWHECVQMPGRLGVQGS